MVKAIKPKASNVAPKEKKGKPTGPQFIKYILQNYKVISQAVLALVVVILAYLVWDSSKAAVKNLINADVKDLSSAFFGIPHVFMCNRGGKLEGMPTALSEFHGMVGSKVAFAVVNCSQVLPSGKNMWQKFKLKKEWRPAVFITTQWAKPYQIIPTSMNDLATLRKVVEPLIMPKAKEVEKDNQLSKICEKASGTNPTCLVLLKGKRYTKEHAEVEEKLVNAYPQLPMAAIKAQYTRLSFEDSAESPSDQFALKLYAIRNGTHYLPMVYPVTWTYVKTFVDNAIAVPLDKYDSDDNQKIKLVKPATSAFKQRMSPQIPNMEPEPQQKQKQKPTRKRGTEPTSTAKEPEDKGPKLTPEEEEARRQARERQRREEMERQERELLFEQDSGDLSSDSLSSDDDEEDVIEL